MRFDALRGFGLALIAGALLAAPAIAARVEHNAPVVAATAPTPLDAARTYNEPLDALLAADLDYLVSDARRKVAEGERNGAHAMLIFLDKMAARDWRGARAALNAAPDGEDGDTAAFFEPFLLAAEGRTGRALERVQLTGADALPSPLPQLARALVLESAGRLDDAARAYREIEADLDVTAPPENEPQTLEEFNRLLFANRTANALYRAALVNHRLGRADEARRLYALVSDFAPNSADVEANLERLARGAQPVEPALDPSRALGRWLIFLADYLTQTDGLRTLIESEGPVRGLVSPPAAIFLQFGLLFDPSADDWRIYAASQLLGAEAYDGAARLVAPISATSPYAAEAELTKASIHLARNQDEPAIGAAARAVEMGGARWSVLTGAGDVYRLAGRPADAQGALTRALALADEDEERAEVLRYRAYAHRFAGDIPAAVADARAALALDRGDDTRLMYVSILMDDRAAWADAIGEARALFAERPDSVTRLNTLGYALIQRPEGLEEGYRLLWRGFLLGERDYAVIDSLGWAYYQHGAFEQALALIERANLLTGADENSEILDHLGDVYWRLDRREEARASWRAALEARPDALRRRDLTAKIERGLTTPAPQRRALPEVQLPSGQRDDT